MDAHPFPPCLNLYPSLLRPFRLSPSHLNAARLQGARLDAARLQGMRGGQPHGLLELFATKQHHTFIQRGHPSIHPTSQPANQHDHPSNHPFTQPGIQCDTKLTHVHTHVTTAAGRCFSFPREGGRQCQL
eukprot:363701-Chlamydomonas_euryale.AAC.2